MDEEESGEWGWMSGMGWRIGVSIITFFGLIIFIILWLFFWAGDYTIYQNIAVVIAALLAFFAIMGATWASMWMRRRPW